jgi:hypothetical protein
MLYSKQTARKKGGNYVTFLRCRCNPTTKGLLHQAQLNGFGTDFNAHNAAINDGTHFLDVGLELTGGDAGTFCTHAAQVFGLAAMGFLVAHRRLLTRKITNSRHSASFYTQTIELSNLSHAFNPCKPVKPFFTDKNTLQRRMSIWPTCFLTADGR